MKSVDPGILNTSECFSFQPSEVATKTMLHEQMRSLGKKTYKNFLCSEIFRNWSKLVNETTAAHAKPVKIEHGTLFVAVKNSAFKDQLKFLKEEIIDAINENFGQEEQFIKDIKIAKGFQIVDAPQEKNLPAQIDKPEIKLENIFLTEEEIRRCEEQSEKISNPKLKQIVLNTLLSQARLKKFRLVNGWHKCQKCDALCPPEEIFCEACNIKEREAMVKALFKIFNDAPWLKSWDAQKILLEQMPHMKKECSLDAVESARTSLIQNLASQTRFGDEKSPNALKLVMLEKRLTPEKLTPAIIKRALSELQFNLADLPKFQQK